MTDLDSLIEHGRSLLGGVSPSPWSVDGHSHAKSGCRCFTCHDDPTVWQTTNMVDCDEAAVSGAESCETAGYTLADAELIVWSRNHLEELLQSLAISSQVVDAISGFITLAEVFAHSHKVRGDETVTSCMRCWAPTLAKLTQAWADHVARLEGLDV